MKNEKDVVGFHFQEIPLEEAVNAVIAGDGNYAVVKAKLLEALPHLTEGRAFAFGLPNGKEVEEDSRRGICLALNSTLKKARLPWRVTYSGVKKLFVCVPSSTPKTYSKVEKEVPSVGKFTIKQIENVACEVFHISPDLLQGKTVDSQASKIRKAIIFLAARRYGTKLTQAAEYYGLSITSVYGINGDANRIPDQIKRIESALGGKK